MDKGRFSILQFAQSTGEGIEGFGIINDFVSDKVATIMYVDMDESFGCWEQEFDKLEEVSEETIREKLAEISKRRQEFPYFIIQLNDIEVLSEYHIEEDDFIKNIRKTNDVCLYLEDEKLKEKEEKLKEAK